MELSSEFVMASSKTLTSLQQLKNYDGSLCASGSIVFPVLPTLLPPRSKCSPSLASPFVTIKWDPSNSYSPSFFKEFSNSIISSWEIPQPKLTISVWGSFQDFNMDPKVCENLCQGIVDAAKTSGAWILTSGFDTGVPAQMGRIVRASELRVPTIGVSHLKKVSQAHPFFEAHNDKISYKKETPNGIDSWALDPCHSHFIFVDVQKERIKWGQEQDFRIQLENSLSTLCPKVFIMMEGGKAMASLVEQACERNDCSVILVRGTGGITDFICDQLDPPPLQERERPKIKSKRMKATIENIVEFAHYYRNVTIYDVKKEAWSKFESLILRSVLDNPCERFRLVERLLHTIEWRRIEFFSQILDDSAYFKHEKAYFMTILNQVLVPILESDLPEFYQIIIHHGPDFSCVNMLDLYRLLYDSDSSQVFHLSRQQPHRHCELTQTLSQIPGLSRAKFHSTSLLMTPTFDGLVVWAAVMGRPQLCQVLWEDSSLPIHSALLVCSILRFLGNGQTLKREFFRESADLFETLAMKKLDQTRKICKGHKILTAEWKLVEKNALDLAIESDSTRFLEHRFCQALLEKRLLNIP